MRNRKTLDRYRQALVLLLIATGAGQLWAQDTDKTLVSCATLSDHDLRSGSILTLQRGPQFDGIVFAEISLHRWMAGSDGFQRTQKQQNALPIETADRNTLVQMAIVYEDDWILMYRDGQPYTAYKTQNIDLVSGKDNYVVFGLRHVGGDGSIDGTIPIEPWAWWDFEDDTVADRTARFPHSTATSNVKRVDGRLVLGKNVAVICTRTETEANMFMENLSPYKPTTPRMPDPIPDTWLTYHLAHPGPDNAIPADPNCAIFYKGRYHLFYIYQHHGHSFAHVSSTDMVHWKWHVTTLTPPKTGHGMFSGTAFLTGEGKPAIIYHGEGSNRNQIAFALDDLLDNWSQSIAVEPLTPSGETAEMRHWDPDCWRIGDTFYALGGGANPTLASSTDLKTWTFQGELFHPDFPADLGVAKAEDVSCANMFQLDDKWMLLCISHGLGCRYYLGEVKDGKYLPEHHALMNWARWDFFAPESLLAEDGRRVMWAWCTPWVNDMQRVGRKKDFDVLMNGRIQPGIQSLPRELSLSKDKRLRIKPVRELEALRSDMKKKEDLTVQSDKPRLLKGILGDTMELKVTFASPAAREFGVRLLCDEDGSNGFTIAGGHEKETLTVGYVEPPFQLEKGEDLVLRIFIDKSMIEVFANDRQAAVAWHVYDPKNLHVALFSHGGDTDVKEVLAWNMKSIYGGDTLFSP